MEYVALGDTVRFGICITNPSGLIANLVNADETPRWYAYTTTSGDNPLMQGAFTARSNLIGTYTGNFACTSANNFITGDYVEVHASGKVNAVQGRAIVKTFVIDDLFRTNVIQISGVAVDSVPAVNVVRVSGQFVKNPLEVNTIQVSGQFVKNPLEVNVVQVSGVGTQLTSVVNANVVSVSGIPVGATDDIYFAAVKFVRDSVVPDDEYVVNWFKNSFSLPSGNVTNGAISVFNTANNTSLFTNKVLTYQSVSHGGMSYNEPINLATSGQIYMAIVSGTISGATRTWSNPIGLDYL